MHIGTHKTGTTAIQHFLDQNRSRLLEQGFLYPAVPEGSLAPRQHRYIRVIADDPEKLLNYFNEIIAESPDSNTSPSLS